MGWHRLNYLVDTHALIWSFTEPARLGAAAQVILKDKRNVVFVSAATSWEISTKVRLGKLPQADALVGGYDNHVQRLGLERLDIRDAHALLAGGLDWRHRDPFDRMLAAQSILESLTLITKDAQFATLPGLSTLW